MNYQIIILAAGKGTRMGRSDLPKVLVPIKNKSIILHLIENLGQLQNSLPYVVVVGFQYQLVQSMLGNKHIYAFQQGQFGTGHAVLSAKEKATGENILVLYGDMPFIKSETLLNLINLHESKSSLFTMLTTEVPNFEDLYASFSGFGRIIRDQLGELLQIKEFVAANEIERQIKEVNPGIYLFDAKWLWHNIDQIEKNKQGEYYLTDLMEIAVKRGVKINTLKVDPMEVFGINTPQQLQQAENLI